MLRLFIIIALVFFSSLSSKAESITVGLTEWVGYTNADASGKYHEIIKLIFKQDELNFVYDTYQRTLHYFEQGKYDFIVGVFLEDVNEGFIPYWHLDYEYPLLAFYNKNNSKITSAKDLNGAMLSWLRGYKIAQYIDVPHQSYLVNQERQGFELLLKNRTDAFIDYEYNLYSEYKDKVNFFEVMPSRKIYIAFANTPKARRLAAIFDKQMLKLREIGALADIYQEEYPRTLFEKVDLTRPKIEIRTRDVDLLRGENSALDSSLESSVFSTLLQSLNGFEFDLVKYSNFTNDIEAYSNSTNTCIVNKAKTDDRELHFDFSEPVVMYPGLRLYSSIPLQFPKERKSFSIKTLFEKYPRLTIGAPEGQFFSKQINIELASLPKARKVSASTSTS